MAGLAAASALNVPGLAAGVPGGKPAAKMRFGLTTYQWGKDWDIPTMIANCTKAGALGVELRTSDHYAHGVELEIDADRRREVRKLFADSPVTLIGPGQQREVRLARCREAQGGHREHQALSRSQPRHRRLGRAGVSQRFPEGHSPRADASRRSPRASNAVGAYAADCGQQVRLECHGSAGDLPSIRAIMEQVTQRSVRVKLNSEAAQHGRAKGFEHNFNLVKDFLGNTLHVHDFKDPKFPNQLQIDLLVKMGWSGWVLMESSAKVPDRVQALAGTTRALRADAGQGDGSVMLPRR